MPAARPRQFRLASQKPPNEKKTATSPSASASAIGTSVSRRPANGSKCDQLPLPDANAATTTAAKARSLAAVMIPRTRVLSVRPATLNPASPQMAASATHRSAPAAAGHNRTTYSDSPVASAAVTPGSMTSIDCQP